MHDQSYMYGTPDELRERVRQGRLDQQRQQTERERNLTTGNYPAAWGNNAAYYLRTALPTPELDRLESFSQQRPEYQNQTYADMAQSEAPGPISPWQKYSAVLNARGAQTMFGTPSSITQNPQSSWNTNQAGPRPWGTGNPQAMQGLQRAYTPAESTYTNRLVDGAAQSRQSGNTIRGYR